MIQNYLYFEYISSGSGPKSPTNPPSPILVKSILELVEGKLKVYIIRNYELI